MTASILLFMTILAGNQFILGSVFGNNNKNSMNTSNRKVTVPPPMLISHDAQEMVKLVQ